MANLYGQIDLSKVGDFVRNNPDAVKTVTFRDGTVHKIINISISERRQPDNYGNDHSMRVYVPKEQYNQNVNYYIAELKTRPQAQATPAPQGNAPTQNPLPETTAMPSNPSPAPVQQESGQQGELPF